MYLQDKRSRKRCVDDTDLLRLCIDWKVSIQGYHREVQVPAHHQRRSRPPGNQDSRERRRGRSESRRGSSPLCEDLWRRVVCGRSGCLPLYFLDTNEAHGSERESGMCNRPPPPSLLRSDDGDIVGREPSRPIPRNMVGRVAREAEGCVKAILDGNKEDS